MGDSPQSHHSLELFYLSNASLDVVEWDNNITQPKFSHCLALFTILKKIGFYYVQQFFRFHMMNYV